LGEAESEAENIASVLRQLGYFVKPVIGEDQGATNVLSALYQKPWRILHVSAHGVFELLHKDERPRSGVLLSDGLLITAAEIQAMELVPELVVLSCCHLGTLDFSRAGHKFAASIARELIDIGVRCVIVAGWAVTDASARLFGETFYEELLLRQKTFGDAVFAARRAVWNAQPGDITWGAFQAYGDPGWLAEPRATGRGGPSNGEHFASLHELVDELGQLRVTLARNQEFQTEAEIQAHVELVNHLLEERCPAAWQQLPGLQSALGATFRDLTKFEQAREALLAAVQTPDARGVVPIRDIELLASVETRWGEKFAEDELALHAQQSAAERIDRTKPLVGEQLIDLALERLNKLDDLLSAGTLVAKASSNVTSFNGERAALRGSAWKRKAALYARRMLMCEDPQQREGLAKQLADALLNSVEAYRCAEGVPDSSNFSPYHALNRLELDTLTPWTEEKPQVAAVELAKVCVHRIGNAFECAPNPWDALMGPEALLVIELLDGKLGRLDQGGDESLSHLKRAYSEAMDNMVFKPSELESAAAQLELLSRFYDALYLTSKAESHYKTAERLLELCRQLQRGRPERRDRPKL
jgi:HEPN domain-containing protein